MNQPNLPQSQQASWLVAAWRRSCNWLRQFPHHYVQEFLNSFCRYPLLPLMTLLLLSMVTGITGGGIGIKYLFFHDHSGKGIAIGFFSTLVFVTVLFIGFLLWMRDSSHEITDDHAKNAKEGLIARFARYAIPLSLSLMLTAVFLQLILSTISSASQPQTYFAASLKDTNEPSHPVQFKKPDVNRDWMTVSQSHAEEQALTKQNIRPNYWPFGIGVLAGFAMAATLLFFGSRVKMRTASGQSLRNHDSVHRVRSIFRWACLLIDFSAIALLCLNSLDLSSDWKMRASMIVVAVVLLTLSWWAERHARAAGFLIFIVVQVLATHLVLTWLVHATSGMVIGGVEFGGWWLGGFIGLVLVVGAIRVLVIGYPERIRTLFGNHTPFLLSKFGSQANRAAVVLVSATFLLFLVSSTGLLGIEMLVNPAVTTLFLIYVLVLIYGVFAYLVPRGMVVPVTVAALLFLLVGGVQPYKYPIRYPDSSLAPFEEGGEPKYVMDYQTPLALEEQISYERNQQQGVINKLAKEATERADRNADHKIVRYQPADLQTLRDEYAKRDPYQRLIPLKLFTPKPSSIFGFVPEFPKVAPGVEPILLRPEDLGFMGQKPGVQDPRRGPLVLIAVSGGALRAASWTHSILSELEFLFAEQGIDFPSHVRIIAGASGGMLGATQYTLGLSPQNPGFETKDKARLDAHIKDRSSILDAEYDCLVKDSLTPLMNQMVFGDIPNLFSPWPRKYDRGQALEDAWARNGMTKLADDPSKKLKGVHTASTFQDLRQGEREGWRPSLVFSPMMVEDGRRLLMSNLDLRYVVSNDGKLIRPQDDYSVEGWLSNYSREAFEFFRMFPGERKRMPVGTAVRLSAAFPFLSPASVLPTVPRRRVVDAGYYDNFGVSLAATWLFSSAHSDWIKTHASKVLLIQIRAYDSERKRTLGRWEHGGSEKPVFETTSETLFGRALEDVFTPIIGVNKAREGATSFRNDEQLELLCRSIRQDLGVEFGVLNLELDQPDDVLPLNWYMTDKMTKAIRSEAKRILHEDRPRSDPKKQTNVKNELLRWWDPTTFKKTSAKN